MSQQPPKEHTVPTPPPTAASADNCRQNNQQRDAGTEISIDLLGLDLPIARQTGSAETPVQDHQPVEEEEYIDPVKQRLIERLDRFFGQK